MKIVIDGRMYSESGVGRYIRNLISYLQILDLKNEYFILLLKKDYDKLVFKDNFKKVVADFRWYGILEQIRLPKILNSLDPDLVHFPHFNVPLFLGRMPASFAYKGRFIVTIHDLIHQHFQMKRSTTLDPLTYKLKQIGYKNVFKNAIKKAQKILVPSNYVSNLLIKEWQIKGEKIEVTYEGVDKEIFTILDNMNIETSNKILLKFNIHSPYIFYVGNAHPHKNVEGLIKAFLVLKKKFQYLSLVLSGNDHYFWRRIKAEYKHSDIIFTNFVTDEELVALYKRAQVFVLPSFEEGFGIPLLEAMACGVPVVSSNAGSLEEIGKEAAIYFDPNNNEDIADKISKVINNKTLKNSLIEKGRKRVELFSWENLAKKTLEVYKQCVLQ